jgi:hypothetical protein
MWRHLFSRNRAKTGLRPKISGLWLMAGDLRRADRAVDQIPLPDSHFASQNRTRIAAASDGP